MGLLKSIPDYLLDPTQRELKDRYGNLSRISLQVLLFLYIKAGPTGLLWVPKSIFDNPSLSERLFNLSGMALLIIYDDLSYPLYYKISLTENGLGVGKIISIPTFIENSIFRSHINISPL
jgi:hypothetical protein